MKINDQNWSHSCFKSLKLLAFISYGAEPSDANAQGGIKELYFLTVTDFDHKEVFQQSFASLKQAVSEINHKYGHWDHSESQEASSGGCGTCSAH